MTGNADGVDLLEIFRHQLAQHQHRAHGAHPPVCRVLLYTAAGQIVGWIGGRYISENVQPFVHQRCLQTACADVKDQQNRMQENHSIFIVCTTGTVPEFLKLIVV